MTGKVSAFMHIEIVVHDPEASAKFMEEVLGAERAEAGLERYCQSYIPDPDTRVIHMRAGNIIFQLIKPPREAESWWKQLQTNGPSIHNIAIQVDDVEGVRKDMLARGCKEMTAFSADFRSAGYDSDENAKGYAIDASEQIGMRMELIPSESRYEPGR